MIEDFLPYDKETAMAITKAGRRFVRKLLREFRYDREQDVATCDAR